MLQMQNKKLYITMQEVFKETATDRKAYFALCSDLILLSLKKTLHNYERKKQKKRVDKNRPVVSLSVGQKLSVSIKYNTFSDVSQAKKVKNFT